MKIIGKITLLLTLALLLMPVVLLASGQLSVAFFYASHPPLDELKAYNIVVVEPDHIHVKPEKYHTAFSQLFAYVSIGEVEQDRHYNQQVQSDWVLGKNNIWNTRILDLSNPAVRAFLVNKVINPLWQQGYRGFFLDTLDSYQLAVKTPQQREQQVEGLVRLIQTLTKRFPHIKIILNRGFEVIPKVYKDITAVAAESLFAGWNQTKKSYEAVKKQDREWLLTTLNRIKQKYHLPIIIIDYMSPAKRSEAEKLAQKITALGFIPWITDGQLNTMGVGEPTVIPRKILVIYADDNNNNVMDSDALNYAAMPLEYMGYIPILRSVTEPLPSYPLIGRYAGIVLWLDKTDFPNNLALIKWLGQQTAMGIPVVFMNSFGVNLDTVKFPKNFNLTTAVLNKSPTTISIAKQSSMVGFEIKPLILPEDFQLIKANNADILLQLRDNNGQISDMVAITRWGGYALYPFVLRGLPNKQMRWVINPFEFLKKALHLKPIPVPDVTTANGLRLLMTHIDGDGFVSKAEWFGGSYAGKVMLNRILMKYKIPSSVSIIQGEIAANGMYPQQSTQLEKIAREIFALPWVEIASHTYSHPFEWQPLEQAKAKSKKGYNLPIKNYKFNLKAEITDSVNYINTTLAPPNKKCKILFWTGDTNPSAAAVKLTYEDGLLNMNGGDTVMTNSNPSLTAVAPLGVYKGKYFQVFAPNQNENVYTNNWKGPFFGYQRAIETFQLTNTPRRLKPIDIYYHFYSATKQAGLQALYRVYAWALQQQTFNVFASDYIHKVLDFNHIAVAKLHNGWMIYGTKNLREIRVPMSWGYPNLLTSQNVIGFNQFQNNNYIHLGPGKVSRLVMQTEHPQIPYLVTANGFVDQFSRKKQKLTFELRGYVPLKFSLANMRNCHLKVNGKDLQGEKRANNDTVYQLKDQRVAKVTIQC